MLVHTGLKCLRLRITRMKKKYILLVSVIYIVLIVSLVPILYMSQYDFATGDDLGYGAATHYVWSNTHSIIQLFRQVGLTIKDYYYSWQGTWFTIGLMSLQPEVFSSDAYCLTPWIMILVTILATTLMTYTILVRYLRIQRWAWLSINAMVLLATIQFFPSTASGIFWFNGGAHYIIPFGIGMLAIWSILQYHDNGKALHLVIASISMTCLGGSSYLMPVLMVVILIYMALFDIFNHKKFNWGMLVPLILEIIGLIVSYLSPGNKVRGGEGFGISVSNVLYTIAESIKQAMVYVWIYFKEYPAIYICLIVIGMISFEAFFIADSDTEESSQASFKHPVLFIIAMFGLFASVFAPGVYVGGDVSGGVPNTIFQVYMLTTTFAIVYLVGWFSKHYIVPHEYIPKRWLAYILLLCLGIIWCGIRKYTFHEATAVECIEYINSGQADDYLAQMEYNRTILLDNTVLDCYLCPVSDEQGPLMHMPVTSQPDAFTNMVTRDFYKKNLVVMDDSLKISSK